MSDTAALLRAAAARLAAAGVDSPRLDARVLLAHVLGVPASILISSLSPNGGEGWGEGAANPLSNPPHPDPLPQEGRGNWFWELIARRAAREPLAYIVGHREFWSLDFAVGPGVLVPRPETETLIEEALRLFPDRAAPLSILDLGAGSGCLLLTLLREFPNAAGTGIDRSAQALAYARRNAESLGVAVRANLREGEWSKGLGGSFDLIVSNPPYIPRAEWTQLSPEIVDHEPQGALIAGEDGLDAYRLLSTELPRLMHENSRVLLEIGSGQADAVSNIFRTQNLEIEAITPDLSGIPRCVALKA